MTEKRTDRNAEYISIPVNFVDDIKIKPFVRKFGDAGVSFCLKMFCFLASQTGFEYEATKESLSEVADYLGMDDKDFMKLWKYATQEKKLFQIVDIDGTDHFRSEYLEEKLLDQLLKKRNRNKRNMRNARKSDEKKPEKKIELDPRGNPIR